MKAIEKGRLDFRPLTVLVVETSRLPKVGGDDARRRFRPIARGTR